MIHFVKYIIKYKAKDNRQAGNRQATDRQHGEQDQYQVRHLSIKIQNIH